MAHQDKFKVGWSSAYGKNYDKIDWKKSGVDSGENQQKQGDGKNGKNQH